MLYYGIKNKKTGELVRQFFRQDPGNNISVLSFDNVPGALCFHIFLTADKNGVETVLREGIFEKGKDSYMLAISLKALSEDLEIYQSEFNL